MYKSGTYFSILLSLLLSLAVCAACAPHPITAVVNELNNPVETESIPGFTQAQIATLNSLQQVDDFPLYTMHYYADYGNLSLQIESLRTHRSIPPNWGCALFTALCDPHARLFGRNFDWQDSPALLLFTHPPHGYDSVSLVDIAYLGYDGERAQGIADLPLSGREALLETPWWTFDGMNEHGLAVGMAAVSPGGMQHDPNKETRDSLSVMREILDIAGTVDQAVAILSKYNIDFGGGPPLHYLVADANGRSALVEFQNGEMRVLQNEDPWQQATNYLVTSFPGSQDGHCWRYDTIRERLSQAGGWLTTNEAMQLLWDVSQENTQWSLVYGLDKGEISVVLGRSYQTVHKFELGVTK